MITVSILASLLPALAAGIVLGSLLLAAWKADLINGWVACAALVVLMTAAGKWAMAMVGPGIGWP